MKPLLIGQAPGPRSRPEYPLFPYPAQSAGARLQTFAGLTRGQYLRGFDRMNLLNEFPGKDPHRKGDNFPLAKAAQRAEELRPLLMDRRVILIGRYVAKSFGYDRTPFFEWCHDSFDFCIVPHPSGLSRAYNEPEPREMLKSVMIHALRSQLADATTEALPTMVPTATMGA